MAALPSFASLPAQPLTTFRRVEPKNVYPAPEAVSEELALSEKLTRLVAYGTTDGIGSALRRIRTARQSVGEYHPHVRLEFTARQRIAGDGSLLMGTWSGLAVGQLLQGREDNELISWHYELDEDCVTDRIPTLRVPIEKTSEKPHIGLIGAGAFAWNVIVPALRSAGAHVVAVTDASRVRSVALAKAARIPLVVDPPVALFQPGRGLDGVVIACAHSVHTAYACQALKSGYNVLVEKPAALNGQNLAVLVEAARQSGQSLYVGHNRRYARGFGALEDAAKRENASYLYAGVEAYPLGPLHWYRAPDQGGRALGNLTHWLDLAIAVHGDRLPSEVRLRSATGDGLGVDLRFPGGSIGELRLFDVGHRALGGREMIMLVTPQRTIRIDNWRNVVTESRVKRRTMGGFRDRGHTGSYRMWVSSLTGQPSPTKRWLDELVRSHLIAFTVADLIRSGDERWRSVGSPEERVALLDR